MARAEPQFDAIRRDHLRHGLARHLCWWLGRQSLFQATTGLHIGQAQIEPVVMTRATAALTQSLHAGPKWHAPLNEGLQHEHGGEQRIAFRQMQQCRIG